MLFDGYFKLVHHIFVTLSHFNTFTHVDIRAESEKLCAKSALFSSETTLLERT